MFEILKKVVDSDIYTLFGIEGELTETKVQEAHELEFEFEYGEGFMGGHFAREMHSNLWTLLPPSACA
jgi:hypothetical protein